MPGIFACSSAASINGGSWGSIYFSRNVPSFLNIPQLRWVIGPSLCRARMLMLHGRVNGGMKRIMSRANAKWLFGGDGQGKDPNSEASEAAHVDVSMLFYQLDLEMRIQYALNTEQFDEAKLLREKLNEVESEIIKQSEAKRGSSKSEAQGIDITLLRLRADLQKAIENENYSLAAELRDEISKLEAEFLAASAKTLAYQNVQYAFRLGQKVRHKVFGYKAVICGMDPVCCESKSWMELANIDKLQKGPNQPFYQVLVDVYGHPDLLVAYVAEENLLASEKPEEDTISHPYLVHLFYGRDTAGDFIPIKQLREKFDQPRYEAPDKNDDDSDQNS